MSGTVNQWLKVLFYDGGWELPKARNINWLCVIFTLFIQYFRCHKELTHKRLGFIGCGWVGHEM
jgi:hypothetical protein